VSRRLICGKGPAKDDPKTLGSFFFEKSCGKVWSCGFRAYLYTIKQTQKHTVMKTPTTKVSFESNGLKFKNVTVVANSQTGAPLYTTMRGVGQVVRQYMKQKFTGVPFQMSTDSYSMGDSVRLYLNPAKVDNATRDAIADEMQAVFQYGNFNGMEDIYEFKGGNGFVRDAQNGIEFSTKFFFVEYRPKFGTKEYDAWQSAQA